MAPPVKLPDVWYGVVGKGPNGDPMDADIGPDDDEELAQTPDDVIAILGFDPMSDSDDMGAGKSR